MIDLKNDHRLAHTIGMSMLRQGFRAPRPDAELLVERTPSDRAHRRQRAADSRANGKKSRRNAFRARQAAHHFDQNLLGVARVYLDGSGTPALRRNATAHVHAIAEQRAEQTKKGDEPTEREQLGALKEVEGKLLSALVASRAAAA